MKKLNKTKAVLLANGAMANIPQLKKDRKELS